MIGFNSVLARMCAQSGGAYLHLDCPSDQIPDGLAAVIGADDLAVLRKDEEVQILPPGNPAQSGSAARDMFRRAVAMFEEAGATGANALCITSSGEVTTWYDGVHKVERLEKTVLMDVFRQRHANAIASAG